MTMNNFVNFFIFYFWIVIITKTIIATINEIKFYLQRLTNILFYMLFSSHMEHYTNVKLAPDCAICMGAHEEEQGGAYVPPPPGFSYFNF